MLGEPTPGVPRYPRSMILIHYRVTLELGLPRIVVIGSQSVGKSSLIENISGVRLELIDLKFVSYSVIDNRPSRQWDMHQVTNHTYKNEAQF